jgi:hypothetical protein
MQKEQAHRREEVVVVGADKNPPSKVGEKRRCKEFDVRSSYCEIGFGYYGGLLMLE